MDYKISGNQLPLSCCNRLINGICTEKDSYRLGCFQIINEYMQLYSKLIVAVGIGIALLEVNFFRFSFVNNLFGLFFS